MARDSRLDSIKGFLIFLVVVGHTIELGAHGGELYKVLYTGIYMFHMPMFVMISGFVFSVDNTIDKLRRGLIHLAEALVVFQLLHIVLGLFLGDKPSIIDLTTPRWTLWYLFSLIVWRIITYFIFKGVSRTHKGYISLLVLSFVMALGAGFVPVDAAFVFQRTFTFFPCFVIGVVLRQLKLQNNRNLLIFGGALLIISLLTLSHLQGYSDWTWSGWCGYAYHDNFTWAVRLSRLGVGIAISLLLLICFPKWKLFELLGLASLTIYLFHAPIIIVMNKMVEHGYLPYGFKTALIYSVIITIVCFMISKIKYTKYLINPITELCKR